tara:strand:- start:222 stop:383 length:162 start_codon:yes stop_codon:yes gene_type:complete
MASTKIELTVFDSTWQQVTTEKSIFLENVQPMSKLFKEELRNVVSGFNVLPTF